MFRLLSIATTFSLALASLNFTACTFTPPSKIEPPPLTAKDLPKIYQAHRGEYIRTIQSGTDTFSLQTGSRLYRKAGSTDVDLIGAIHAAEPAYYQELKRDLSNASLVLYEGVTDENQPRFTDAQREKAMNKSAYNRLANTHGLVSQHRGIPYAQKHYRNCDMSFQQMQQTLQHEIAQGGSKGNAAQQAYNELNSVNSAVRGNNFMINTAISLIGSSHALKSRTRFMLVSMGAGKSEDHCSSPRLQTLMIQDRNAHVITELQKTLRKEPNQRRIALFFGAAHLPDFEKRLLRLGYRPAGPIRWHNAITSHPYSSGLTDKEVQEMLSR